MTETASTTLLDTRELFVRALRRALRPIIRLMIRSGIRYDEFVDAARRAYVESAIRDADKEAPRPTRDQVARQTGIRRELVDHYIDDEDPLAREDKDMGRIASEILHVWHTDPRYLGPSGAPLDLDFGSPSGRGFQDIVAEIDAGIDPELILDELLRLNVVARSDTGHIRAVSRTIIWPETELRYTKYLGNCLAHLIETLDYNLTSKLAEHKRLERTASSDRKLSENQLQRFHEFSRERTGRMLNELDDWLGQSTAHIDARATQRTEIGIHVFFYTDETLDPIDLAALVQPPKPSPAENNKPD